MRINKFIASNSQFSRRKADELIEEGKVFLNGKKITELGTTIDPQKDQITIGKQKIRPQSEKVYLALNKPKGYITTRSDEHGRKTVMDLAPKISNLKPVGRLDKDSEGLLLLSNDGEFINKLTHPKYRCEKKYLVKIKGKLTSEELSNFQSGIKINGKSTAPAIAIIKEESERQTILTVTIHEGRNRQIRKMFAYLGHPVKYLQRLSIGDIKLGSLKPGSFRNLTKYEINAQ